jgi:hypothetical protein
MAASERVEGIAQDPALFGIRSVRDHSRDCAATTQYHCILPRRRQEIWGARELAEANPRSMLVMDRDTMNGAEFMIDELGRVTRTTIPPIPWRGVVFWGVLILFLPLAFLGVVVPANEYASWGGGGVDCDGPAGIWFSAVPAMIVYGLAALVFIHRAFRRRSWGAGMGALACLLLVLALANNLGNAYREAAQPYYSELCLGR